MPLLSQKSSIASQPVKVKFLRKFATYLSYLILHLFYHSLLFDIASLAYVLSYFSIHIQNYQPQFHDHYLPVLVGLQYSLRPILR